MKKNILTFVLVIALSVNATSQNQFEVLNTPTENTFIASSFITDNEGWLADNQSILWNTKDAGTTIEVSCTGIQFTKLDFIDSLNGFALGKGVVYRTHDGGVTWQRADETASFNLPEFDGYYKAIDGANEMYLLG